MKKNVILFVNAIRPATLAALREHEERTGQAFMPVILVDTKIKESITERNLQKKLLGEVARIEVDFDSPKSIRQALKPYMSKVFAVTAQYENSIHELKKLVPYLPHLPTPTESSLEWATEKKLMRELMESHDTSLVPQYMEVQNNSEDTLDEIEASMTYPLIVKPSGLEGSLLVTRVENRDELRDTLEVTFDGIQKAYDKWIKRQAPTVLVEEFMDGDMYSVDAYVASDGTCEHTPVVKVVTGRKAGFEDFFGYMQSTPSDLNEQEIKDAYATVEKACTALGLKSVTAHVELMKLGNRWKIVELGPRIGGFRHDIYHNSYGINHIVNDILNRGGEKPHIPKDIKRHTAFFNVYAQGEGILDTIIGLDKIRELPSFVSLGQNIGAGESVRYAKNNGDPVIVMVLSHTDHGQLHKDIAEFERVLDIRVKADSKPKKRPSVPSL